MKNKILLREDRIKKVDFALAINALDGAEPSKKGMELLQNYIDGKDTIEENIEKLKAIYSIKKG